MLYNNIKQILIYQATADPRTKVQEFLQRTTNFKLQPRKKLFLCLKK